MRSGADYAASGGFALRGPRWVYGTLQDQARARLPVVWSPSAVAELRAAIVGREAPGAKGGERRIGAAREGAAPRKFYGASGGDGDSDSEAELSAFVRAINQSLSLDIRAVHQGRGDGAKKNKSARPEGPEAGAKENAEGEDDEADSQFYEIFFDGLRIQFLYRDAVTAGETDELKRNGGREAYISVFSVDALTKEVTAATVG